MPNLFDGFDLKGLALPNRIAMSAMTRTRATDDGIPTDLMRDYYVQRASAGLIVTECTQVSDQGHGIIRCPGLHRDDQIAGWRRVTDAVHDAGGHIYCQLWHCGRVAHPGMRGGEPPVGPSPIPATGDFFLPSGRVDFPVPRELAIAEIPSIVASFAQATRNAREAGFDGVELHGANGYLQDQFLQNGSNKRTDAYGGPVENRARLMLETAAAMIGAWSAESTGVRLAPSSFLYGVDDSDKLATFGHVVRALDAMRIGYLCLLEPNGKDTERGVQIRQVAATFRPMTSVPIIVNTGFDRAKADTVLAAGDADLVAFGVPYIANPDLVARLHADAPLNKPDPSKFYGQGLVYQSAMWGIGMAKVLYTNAIQAVGPDAVVIAQPMVPGTEQVILGLINNELCADLVNLASNTSNMVPPPTPVTGTYPSGGGYSSFNYALSVGNQSGTPACGTVTIQTPAGNQATIAGQPVDMAAIQQAALSDVLNGSIRGPVQQVAQNLWQNKTVASLVPLQGILTSATQAYTRELTAAATSVQSAINSALQSQATQARNGNIDLLQGQVQQSTLGWTAAGSYYLEIARANATTLSLLTATPVVTPPSYDGLGPALSQDLAPLEAASKDFLNLLQIAVQTQDSTSPPAGMPQTLAGAQDNQSQSLLTRLFTSMNLTTPLLNSITGFILPTGNMWRDPFGGLMAMGQTLIITSMIAFGTAALLSSSTIATGSAIFNFLTGNWGAAAASVAINAVMSFLGVPIFMGLLALMIPGILIAYVLPMIPWVLWMAGVCGWIILVCEAMIAVPLWMLAHMTVGGDGLHGRAIEGWGLLFNVVFRPTLMVIGLFLGYFVFACMSYLIRQTFGIAAGFALSNGWLVTNFLGVAVLLNIFVMTHVTAALMSFRLVALMPHHLPRLIGFSAANRVDTEAFYTEAAWAPGARIASGARTAIGEGAGAFGKGMGQLRGASVKSLAGPASAAAEEGGMDSTLRATTDTNEGEAGESE